MPSARDHQRRFHQVRTQMPVMIRGLVAVIVVVSLAAPGLAATPQVASGKRTRPHVHVYEAKQKTDTYIGIIGQVSRPGTYHLSGQTADLATLLQDAGGLTTEATGSIRLIRNGRAGQQIYYHDQIQFKLKPGDVLCVDGQRGRRFGVNGVSQIGFQSEREMASATSETLPPRQIAIIGALDRPTVLKVRGEDANVPRMLQLLGQNHISPQNVRLIAAGMQSRKYGPEELLPDGTVLVLEPYRVIRDQLPEFPPAIEASAQPESMNSVPELATDSEVLSPLPGMLAHSTPTMMQLPAPKSSSSTLSDLTLMPRLEMLPPPPESHVATNSIESDVAIAGTEIAGSHLSFLPPDPGPLPNGTSVPGLNGPQFYADNTNNDANTVDDSSSEVIEVATIAGTTPMAATGTSVGWTIIGVLAAVIGATASAFVAVRKIMLSTRMRDRLIVAMKPRRVRKRVRAAVTPALIPEPVAPVAQVEIEKITKPEIIEKPEEIQAKEVIEEPQEEVVAAREPELSDSLSTLIRGTLLIEEEPVHLPTAIRLHGRSLGMLRLRIDDSEATLSQPHFAKNRSGQRREILSQMAAVMDDAPSTSKTEGIRIDEPQNAVQGKSQPQMDAGPLARALARQSAAKKS
ncbi:polysaccharide biosynthesis/export family protein [Calycomorphotria hydatis]|uniref:SLBB domain protein n=1 Tax=Calycomorphotria hydatis TaxID=2528027 RepID=A0A517T624_9PLAN|nr:hypothetical protein [Calycomorphotria hydatis]QDT63813.1 hypothetical protein V22_10380 [Calycomorphotria hydatis]